jgi:outer membrane scaffolding protein for murein synthesis (MipA/OmpV family)
MLQTMVSDRELVGDAADSPIVRSKNQASIVTGIAYHF